MTNENFEEQKNTGLGINAFQNPKENQELETKQEESCYGRPEKYDYSGVTLPETGGIGMLPYLLIGTFLILTSIIYGYNYFLKMKEGGY